GGGPDERGDAPPGAARPAGGGVRTRRPQVADHRPGGAAHRPRRPGDRGHARRGPGGRGDRAAAAHRLVHRLDQPRPVPRPADGAPALRLRSGGPPLRHRDRPGVDRRAHPDPDRHAAQPRGARHRVVALAGEERILTVAQQIEVSDLTAYYGSHKAVEGITMTIEPRTVTALIGPSGCGKSTFLRTLNRMHEVVPGARVEGKVRLGDEDIYAPDADPVSVRRTIGMVFQRPNPFPTMSIFDNVAAGLRLNGRIPRSELEGIVEESLKGANLWHEVKDRLHKPGASLSGGQQQ